MSRVFKPIGSVNLSALLNTSIGHSTLFHAPIAVRMDMAANAGLVIGSMILKQMPYSVAPSIRPASRSSFGSPVIYCLKKKIVDAPHIPGSTTPAMVSIRPMVIISLYKGRIRISKGTIMVAMTRKNRKFFSL